jgi:hypothetical protein
VSKIQKQPKPLHTLVSASKPPQLQILKGWLWVQKLELNIIFRGARGQKE